MFLDRHVEAIVSCLFARFVVFVQGFGFSREQDGAAGFFEYDDDEGDEDSVGNRLHVEDPAPRCVLRDEAGDQGAKACAEERTTREEGHGRIAVFSLVDVGYNAADHSGEGRATYTNEEAYDKHAGVGLCEAAA